MLVGDLQVPLRSRGTRAEVQRAHPVLPFAFHRSLRATSITLWRASNQLIFYYSDCGYNIITSSVRAPTEAQGLSYRVLSNLGKI